MKLPKFRMYPLRDVDVDMNWVIDSSIHGCVNGGGKKWNMWIAIEKDADIIKSTIAHELAHIHAYRFYRKEKGDKIFYSHGKLHKTLEKYYMENWMPEINKLYRKLKKSELDIYSSNKYEIIELVDSYLGKVVKEIALA